MALMKCATTGVVKTSLGRVTRLVAWTLKRAALRVSNVATSSIESAAKSIAFRLTKTYVETHQEPGAGRLNRYQGTTITAAAATAVRLSA